MAATASPLDAALWLRPGPQGWVLQSTRQEWAARLLAGRPADDAPRLLPSLYSLCGGAHRIASRHALAAARGEPAAAQGDKAAPAPGAGAARALRLDTLREHLRRLWLSDPRQFGALPPATVGAAWAGAAVPEPSALARCPLMAGGDAPTEEALAAGRRWVEAQVLGADVDEWLAAWQADAAGFAARWADSCTLWPARWLATLRHKLEDLRQPVLPVLVSNAAAHAQALHQLVGSLRGSATFALAPTQDGQHAETGCWTRAADPWARPGREVYAPLWMRHAARLAEVAHLAGPLGEHWLAQGALATGQREGLGWCEMARGLLVHWLCLDEHGRIARYRVLAPTEWNFHPQGGAARLLVSCIGAAWGRVGAGGAAPSAFDVAQVRAIAAAYDPCVELHIEPIASRPNAVDQPHPTVAGEAPHA